MRSRAVSRPFLCWDSIAFSPPPRAISSSWLRMVETSSAMARIFFSKRAEVGSIFDSITFRGAPGSVGIRSAITLMGKLTRLNEAGGARNR